MGKFKIEDIKNEIENKGWILESTTYTNLKSDLELICPENHSCITSFGQWRKGYECPICKQNQYYKISTDYIKKNGYRILSLDQATITSGWSIFDNQSLVSYGANTSKGKDSIEKISNTKYWVASLIEKWKPDEVILEDIQLQSGVNKENFVGDTNVVTFKKLAHLQGTIMNYVFEKQIPFRIVPPATWRNYSQIKGKYRTDKKKNAQLKIKNFYDISVTEDEADAILIGRWAASTHSKNDIIEF